MPASPESQADSQLVSRHRFGFGTIVKLSGLPLNCDQLHIQLPGLTQRVRGVPETEYALVTTHSLIPKYSDVKFWKIEFLSHGEYVTKETLDKYVSNSGVVSCCGKESSFIIPGPTTAFEHRNKACRQLNLNFTVLFLNKKFKQEYCTLNANQPNTPCVNINQYNTDVDLLFKHLHPPSAQEHEVNGTTIEVGSSTNSATGGTFEVITGTSSVKVSLSVIPPKKPYNEPSVLNSNMELARDICMFQRVKTVQYCSTSVDSVEVCAGMPLVYTSTDGELPQKLIGVITNSEGGQALILSSLFYLLQGITPALTTHP